jgi:predicted outer membrane repeat protein
LTSDHRKYFSATSPNDNTTFNKNTGTWSGAGIYAESSIVSGQWIASHAGTIGGSDERIKKEIVDVEDGAALETLRLLKPKQYKYKDVINRGDEPVWGFIAQEVGATLPYATQLLTDCLPNIYELANVSNSNVITFTNFDTSNLESNAMVLKVYDVTDTDHLINITEVIDEHSVRVNEDLSEWTGSVDESGNVVAGNELFVYGQRVDDFHFLKKDAIWTVATSALQEVDRQLQAEKARNDALEARISALEKN